MDQPSHEVSVTGVGEVSAPPDVVVVELGVSILDQTVATASAGAASAARRLVDSLTGNGVERSEVSTMGYSIIPEYDWVDNQRRLLGYRVTNTLRARVSEADRAGDILDAAVAAGGDHIQVNSLRFEFADEHALLARAREAAWVDASAKAGQLAELAGQPLGPALSVTESGPGAPGPLPLARLRMEAADVTTPVEGGSSTVTVTLQVRFALGDRPT